MSTRKKNPVALTLKILAGITGFGGLIEAFALAHEAGVISLVVFVATVVVGFFIYGFGEIVDLLAQIMDNTSTQAKAAPVPDELPAL